MIYLILSVLSATSIYIVFRLLGTRDIPLLPVILINYLVCIGLGLILMGGSFEYNNETKNLILKSMGLGLLFVLIFVAMGKTTKHFGVAVVSVASKMSLVIPVAFILFYYGEKTGILFWPGLIGTLIAIYLLTFARKGNGKKPYLFLPIVVWLGSGLIDSLLKYLDYSTPAIENKSLITSVFIFLGAFIFGSVYYLANKWMKKIPGNDFALKTLFWGIMLGIPNLFSIWFLLLAIGKSNLPGSVIFPVNNSGIVVLSVLVAAVFFQERFTLKKVVGLVLALISIVLLSIDTYVIY
jgi:drug/metabolite transporter (DMT)-like permease